jgi:2,4-dienoyl-CoA reductase-like NADH-dependent reductase (Old Yellow Enzyme family)
MTTLIRSSDPLLQPFKLKHLTLKNRIMSTSHEPNASEDGMPKDRYRLYHVEKAKGGIALTMTAGSAVVSRDSPAVFGNLLAYKDEIVPWLRRLADECHDHGTAVMIQLTHLGRRTVWNKPVNLPTAPFPRRWRIGTSSASSPTMPMRPNACARPISMASRYSATAT